MGPMRHTRRKETGRALLTCTINAVMDVATGSRAEKVDTVLMASVQGQISGAKVTIAQ